MIDEGTKKLRVASHSSFASFSPFVDSIEGRRGRSPRFNTSRQITTSVDSSFAVTGSSILQQEGRLQLPSPGARPVPTLLELGALRGGAAKRRPRRMATADEDDAAYEGDDECVEKKLVAALCLSKSRSLGLDRETVKLRTFQVDGGAPSVATGLARFLSARAKDDHDLRRKSFMEQLKPFCIDFGVSYDDALLSCTKGLCRMKTVASMSVQESASIARCCSSVLSKCKAALLVLRAALFCGYSPDWLAGFSRDAIVWASCDSALQSELEEATRLLSIDHIVLKYCGSGAKDLFRVDNPRHSVRLLNFVAKHVQNVSVISDVLALCGAFHHLSREDAVSSVMYYSLVQDKPDLSVQLLRELFEKDFKMAQVALIRTLAYTEDMLNERSQRTTVSRITMGSGANAVCVEEHAIELLTCALEFVKIIDPSSGAELPAFPKDGSLVTLRADFLRILKLRRDHGVAASLSKLRSPRFFHEETLRLLRDAITFAHEDDLSSLRMQLTNTKRACSLLSGESKQIKDGTWSAAVSAVITSLVHRFDDNAIMDLLSDLSLLDPTTTAHSTLGQINVALSCYQHAASQLDSASGMQQIGVAAALLKDWALVSCPESLTAHVVTLASNLDLVCHILTRSDEGVGESFDQKRQSLQARAWKTSGSPRSKLQLSQSVAPLCPPKLHPWWYVGDGLLLPPSSALAQSVMFSKWMAFDHLKKDHSAELLFEFISGRGAHSLSLRMLSSWSSILLSQSVFPGEETHIDAIEIGINETKVSLAERSLGGSGTGITNAVVDSELALSFLLCLPMRQAFKTFKACLPTALKTRDFRRLLSLSNVGIVASNGGSAFGDSVALPICWQGQPKFFEQCKQLSCRAKWSSFLDRYDLQFDPQRFDEQNSVGPAQQSYVTSLLPSMMSALSRLLCTSDVISLATRFAQEFGLSPDVVIEKHIEFLMSSIEKTSSKNKANAVESDSLSLSECERVTKASLRLLPSPVKRSAVLRRCLVALESDANVAVDYERHGLVLSLYQEALAYVVDNDMAMQGVDVSRFEAELELIDRRRDALSILSSFYQNDKECLRPPFSSFFPPLEVPFPKSPAPSSTKHSVLGKKLDDESLDPIAALEQTFKECPDTATASSLAPLCLPLGLPAGYIHARSLVVRFMEACKAKTTFPSFENDVVPVCDRLRSVYDKATMAEWCAGQYFDDDAEKLKSLDLALESAMIASAEIEARRRRNASSSELEGLEKAALDTVKRISTMKDCLSDRLRVKDILRSTRTSAKDSTNRVSEALIKKLDNDTNDMSPERLIVFLIEEGSLVAATSCLDGGKAFSISQLRKFSSMVHEACLALAENHSHIHPHQYCRRYARKWLLHGDDVQQQYTEKVEPAVIASQTQAQGGLVDHTDKDKVDFVMDLTDLQSGDDWDSSVAAHDDVNHQLTNDEEPSSVKETSSRERSENASKRASLRIAFVLASPEPENEAFGGGKENKETRANPDPSRPPTKVRKGLLSKIDTKRDSRHEDWISDLCKGLLRIVFAATTSFSSLMKLSSSFDTTDSAITDSDPSPKSITFAMRHRALRAVSVLCPQEALERVIRSEGLAPASTSGDSFNLRKCSFGSFVSKEIEEMGLPLPHADLARLSSMHFLSYARTLWRHHRGNDTKSKGRLLLLLVEMSLTDPDTDQAFVETLLQEIIRLRLPRTLLLALECVRDYASRRRSCESVIGLSISQSLKTIGNCVLEEVRSLQGDVMSHDSEVCIQATMLRLYEIIAGMSLWDNVNSHVEDFLELITTLSSNAENEILSTALRDIADRAKRLCDSANC